MMNQLIYNALTIPEKINHVTYKDNNPQYFNQWNSINSLVNPDVLNEICHSYKIEYHNFPIYFQPYNSVMSNTLILSFDQEFQKMIESFDFTHIRQFDLGTLYLPFIDYVLNQVKASLPNKININESCFDKIVEYLNNELFTLCGKVQALELHKYKLNHSNDKKLDLINYVKNQYQSKLTITKFFQNYPTLMRLVVHRLNKIIQNFTNLFQRIANDQTDIINILSINAPLVINDLQLNAGDSHSGAQSVIIITLNEQKKLVYKPRNLQVLSQFKKLYEWINIQAKQTLLPINFIPAGIYRSDYSYIKFLSPMPTENHANCLHYYERYGYLILLSYLLGITDLHLENIIAINDTPYLLDLETIFQNKVVDFNDAVSNLFYDLNAESINASCLLPTKLMVNEHESIELSAFKGKGTKLKSSFLGPVDLDNLNFHFTKKKGSYFAGGDNIPKDTNGNEINYLKYRHAIIWGFNKMANFIFSNRNNFINEIKKFSEFQIRILTKSTERYASMLRYANHPNYNHQMQYREKLLFNTWVYPYHDKSIIKSEVKDLIYNDIPFFYTQVKSTSIFGSDGTEYPKYFEKSGLQLAINRIHNFSEVEYENQKTILYDALDMTDELICHYTNQIKETENDQFDYISIAERIAHQIMDLAYKDDQNCILKTFDYSPDHGWRIYPTNENLYCGLSGISIFFIHLYQHTEKRVYQDFFNKSLHQAIEFANLQPIKSAYSGFLAPLYPLLLIATKSRSYSSQEIHYLNQLESKLNSYIETINDQTKLDFMGGLGGVVYLLNLQKQVWNDLYVSNMTLKRLNNIFSKNVIKFTNVFGFAHGFSGLSLPLYLMGRQDLAIKLLKKEAKLDEPQIFDQAKWCRGIPGILMVKALLNQQIDLMVPAEAFEKIDDTLCHGKCGLISSYLYLSRKLNNQYFYNYAFIMANAMLSDYLSGNEFKLKLTSNSFQPGLYDGLSGIGLTILSLSYDDIKNPLIFEL